MISDIESSIVTPSRRRKLTIQDIEAIAACVATMKLTETEACLHLGIKPKQWVSWKSKHRHGVTFDAIITRTRANSIAGLVGKIQRAGDDQEIILPNGKIINKRGDWHAPAWLLEKTAPQFKPDNGQAPAPQVTVQIGIIHDQLKRVIGFDDIKLIDNEHKIKMPMRRCAM